MRRADVIRLIREHKPEIDALGVTSLSLFGSVADRVLHELFDVPVLLIAPTDEDADLFSGDRWIAPVVGQQRAQHGGVGQQKDATGVEQDCVKVPYSHRVNITFRCA